MSAPPYRQSADDVDQADTEKRGDGQRQDERRERQEGVHGSHEEIGPRDLAHGRPPGRSGSRRHPKENRDHADGQGKARADDDVAQDVAAEGIGAEE